MPEWTEGSKGNGGGGPGRRGAILGSRPLWIPQSSHVPGGPFESDMRGLGEVHTWLVPGFPSPGMPRWGRSSQTPNKGACQAWPASGQAPAGVGAVTRLPAAGLQNRGQHEKQSAGRGHGFAKGVRMWCFRRLTGSPQSGSMRSRA